MAMYDTMNFMVALGLVCLVLVSYLMGRQSHRLHLMEMTAAIGIAKQDVSWQYERYRLEALRMDWVALAPEIRKEYVRTWGRPKWAKASENVIVSGDVA
jgi:hypothetical protein